jgi:hypothetical protein
VPCRPPPGPLVPRIHHEQRTDHTHV